MRESQPAYARHIRQEGLRLPLSALPASDQRSRPTARAARPRFEDFYLGSGREPRARVAVLAPNGQLPPPTATNPSGHLPSSTSGPAWPVADPADEAESPPEEARAGWRQPTVRPRGSTVLRASRWYPHRGSRPLFAGGYRRCPDPDQSS